MAADGASEPCAGRRLSFPCAEVSELVPETAQACWEIRGYSHRDKEKGKHIQSGALVEAAGTRFGLRVFLGGHAIAKKGWFSVYCYRAEDTAPEASSVSVRGALSVIGRGDKVVVGEFDLKVFGGEDWGYADFGKVEELESGSYLVDDAIVFGLKVMAWGSGNERVWRLAPALGAASSSENGSSFSSSSGSSSSSSSSRQPPPDDASVGGAGGKKRERAALAEDLAAFLAGGRATDVELSGSLGEDSEQVVKAHRVVLAARSPVFDRMLLKSGMRESEAGAKISLEGVDHRIAEKFVQFLYTDKLDQESLDSPDDLCNLLTLAHRFEVHSLTELCAASLTITEDNAIDRLTMAERLGLHALREQAMNFLCSCRKRLAHAQKTEAFAEFDKKYPELMIELLTKAILPA